MQLLVCNACNTNGSVVEVIAVYLFLVGDQRGLTQVLNETWEDRALYIMIQVLTYTFKLFCVDYMFWAVFVSLHSGHDLGMSYI